MLCLWLFVNLSINHNFCFNQKLEDPLIFWNVGHWVTNQLGWQLTNFIAVGGWLGLRAMIWYESEGSNKMWQNVLFLVCGVFGRNIANAFCLENVIYVIVKTILSSSVKSKRWLVNVRYVKFVDLNLYVAWSATLTYVNLEPVWIVIVPRMLHRQFYWKPNFFST